jgi:hypothetical protein
MIRSGSGASVLAPIGLRPSELAQAIERATAKQAIAPRYVIVGLLPAVKLAYRLKAFVREGCNARSSVSPPIGSRFFRRISALSRLRAVASM